MAACQEVVDDEISDVAAQTLTNYFIEAEVLAGEDATERRFFVGRGESGERADDAGQHFGGDLEIETIPLDRK